VLTHIAEAFSTICMVLSESEWSTYGLEGAESLARGAGIHGKPILLGNSLLEKQGRLYERSAALFP